MSSDPLSSKLESTTCLICFKTFEDPQILECGHSICKGCIPRSLAMQKALKTVAPEERKKLEKSLTQGKPADEDTSMKDEEDSVLCPVCRRTTPLSKIHDNLILRNAISADAFVRSMKGSEDKDGASKGPKCGFCGKPATKFCCFCGPLCAEHNSFLHVNGPLISHEVSNVPMPLLQTQREVRNAVMGVKSIDELDLPACPDHQRSVSMYCCKCDSLVCSICAVSGKHKDHNMKTLEEALKDNEAKIAEICKEIAEKRDTCTEVISSFEKHTSPSTKERDEILAQVREFFDGLRKNLNEAEAQSLKNVDIVFEEFGKTVKNRLEGARFLKSECEHLLEVAEPLTKRPETESEAGPNLSMTEFMLFKSLKCAMDSIDRLENLRLDDDTQICKVVFPKEPEKMFSSICRVRPQFLYNTSKCPFVNINFETVGETRSVEAFEAGHNGAHDGGAALDPSRRLIVATCGNFDSGRSLSIIHLPETGYEGATVERREDVIPFGTHGQYVVSDGEQFMYFFQSEDGENNRMARLNLDDFTVEDLPVLPHSEFREFTSGCFHNGLLYMMDENYNIWCYNPAESTWRQTRASLPRSARLLNDPIGDSIYAICSERNGVHRINVETEEVSELVRTPDEFTLGANNDAALVRVNSDVFAIFARLRDHWQVYNSESNSWTTLTNWRDTTNGSGHIVVDQREGYIYYHSDGRDTYYAVNLQS